MCVWAAFSVFVLSPCRSGMRVHPLPSYSGMAQHATSTGVKELWRHAVLAGGKPPLQTGLRVPAQTAFELAVDFSWSTPKQ